METYTTTTPLPARSDDAYWWFQLSQVWWVLYSLQHQELQRLYSLQHQEWQRLGTQQWQEEEALRTWQTEEYWRMFQAWQCENIPFRQRVLVKKYNGQLIALRQQHNQTCFNLKAHFTAEGLRLAQAHSEQTQYYKECLDVFLNSDLGKHLFEVDPLYLSFLVLNVHPDRLYLLTHRIVQRICMTSDELDVRKWEFFLLEAHYDSLHLLDDEFASHICTVGGYQDCCYKMWRFFLSDACKGRLLADILGNDKIYDVCQENPEILPLALSEGRIDRLQFFANDQIYELCMYDELLCKSIIEHAPEDLLRILENIYILYICQEYPDVLYLALCEDRIDQLKFFEDPRIFNISVNVESLCISIITRAPENLSSVLQSDTIYDVCKRKPNIAIFALEQGTIDRLACLESLFDSNTLLIGLRKDNLASRLTLLNESYFQQLCGESEPKWKAVLATLHEEHLKRIRNPGVCRDRLTAALKFPPITKFCREHRSLWQRCVEILPQSNPEHWEIFERRIIQDICGKSGKNWRRLLEFDLSVIFSATDIAPQDLIDAGVTSFDTLLPFLQNPRLTETLRTYVLPSPYLTALFGQDVEALQFYMDWHIPGVVHDSEEEHDCKNMFIRIGMQILWEMKNSEDSKIREAMLNHYTPRGLLTVMQSDLSNYPSAREKLDEYKATELILRRRKILGYESKLIPRRRKALAGYKAKLFYRRRKILAGYESKLIPRRRKSLAGYQATKLISSVKAAFAKFNPEWIRKNTDFPMWCRP